MRKIAYEDVEQGDNWKQDWYKGVNNEEVDIFARVLVVLSFYLIQHLVSGSYILVL